MTFKHLSLAERVKIEDYLEQGLNQAEIAYKLDRSRSTISREIKRNSPEDHGHMANMRYLGVGANNVANLRRIEIGTTKKINQKLKEIIEKYLFMRWSPEQIVYGLKNVHVCVNTIYNWIYAGDLDFKIKDLREHGRRYKAHYKGKLLKKREPELIRDRTIENRPKRIQERKEFGHWEIDTVLSSRASSECLATFLERKTRFYYAIKIKKRTADQFQVAMDTFMSNFQDAVKSVTCDHGSEFANGDMIRQCEHEYGISFYYAHAYSPHERGSNEYHNGLLREYFPKKTNFNHVSAQEIMAATDAINSRPRKTLKWKTANVKFYHELEKSY